MLEISWNANIELPNKMIIDRQLKQWLWLVPGWVQVLHINLWDEDGRNEGVRASVQVNYEYRNGHR